MSVFCPHCHKRVILENYKIRGYYGVVEFATCGDIVVERSGHVVAPIKVSNLTIKGKVQGRIKARGRVLVGKTGSIKGDIVAPTLTVEAGAKIQGFLNICPTDAGTP
jgi:cytoskeletal protein CcmA (bactofilin family)